MRFRLNPEYVLDKIKFYEINALFKYSFYKCQDEWEQTRMLGFINAKCAGNKDLTLQKLITFPWEGDENIIRKTEITKTDMEEFDRLKNLSEIMIKNNVLKE